MLFSEHALQRCKERLGWSRAAAVRMLPAIIAEGIELSQCKGSLRRFLDKGCIRYHSGADLRIFGHHIFIIEKGRVITVLDLPKRWHQVVDDLRHSAIRSPHSALA